MKLCPQEQHPHGLSTNHVASIFTTTNQSSLRSMEYHRDGKNFTVRGYNKEGTIFIAFDTTVMNNIDRFHLAIDVCDTIEHEISSFLRSILDKR